ncbi:MAG: restriction endonuclease subunit S [Pseudomonadota bacterium]
MKGTPFTEARLLSLYNRVAEADDAIARLRRFVLDLAVRGKLVPQEAGDEPASALLEQIEKATRKPTRPQSDDCPFALPPGWAWSDIGGICSKTGSGSTPRGGKEVYTPEGIPFLRSQNVYDHGLVLNDVAYISPDVNERMSGTNVLPRDLLLNITGGSMGRCCRVPDRFDGANVSQHVAIIRCAVPEMADFAHVLVRSPYFQGFIFGEQTGAGRGGLPKNRMDRIIVAVPPLVEQRRIVAKVEELMALLDRLEAARAAREETRTRLTAATLSRLNEADTDTSTSVRFALKTLPALTTRSDQIKTLRQTILNLAVRGKLVEQDSGDEPASELIKRISTAFAEKAAKGELNKPKAVGQVSPADELFVAPPSWQWARFAKIASIESNLVDPKRYLHMPHVAPDNIQSWTGRLLPYTSVREAGVFSGKHLFKSGVLLYSKIRPNLAKVTKVDFEGLCSADMYPIFPLIDRDFLLIFMITPHFVNQAVSEDNRVAMPKINQAALSEVIVPVPPLAEQHRIVAKVEELMSLCDRLERALQDATTTRARLLDATLREALLQTEPA